MLLHTLRTLAIVAATAPPFFFLLTGCSFEAPAATPSMGLLFVNIEAGRTCASMQDLDDGIDIAKQDEQGFRANRTSKFGLDYSPAAKQQCNGMPQKVIFQGPFPDGTMRCVSEHIVPASYPTITAAAQAECDKMKLTEEDGTPYHCASIAWPAYHADTVFPDTCTEPGTPSTNFQDPRKIGPMKPVTWSSPVNVIADTNSLTKMSVTPDYDAGAVASTILAADTNGAFEFTAKETNKERVAGFSVGATDNDPGDDVDFAVVLQNNGTLRVREMGFDKATQPYMADAVIRIVRVNGIIAYYNNGKLIYAGMTAASSVLRATVSLKDKDATIKNAQTSF